LSFVVSWVTVIRANITGKALMTDIFSVADKVVCITGSSRGLGKAIARGFAERGAKVTISSWNLAELEATQSEFRSPGLEVYAVEVDVSHRHNCQQLIERTVKHYGAIDVLICNAGIDIIKPGEQYEAEEWDKILDINLRGYYFCAQFAAQQLWRSPIWAFFLPRSLI